MLVLEVEFLTGRYRATSFRDRDAGEWPPHPSRMFSALVAAHHEAGLGPECREALLWLEQQPSPDIAASEAVERRVLQHYVPVNDEASLGEFRNRQPRAFPTMWPALPIVRFIWPDAKPPSAIREALDQLACCATNLGHSSSVIRTAFYAELTVRKTYAPDMAGDLNLRVPRAGRLAELESDFAAERRPSAGPFDRYSEVDPSADAAPVASLFDEMLVVRCAEGRAVPLTATLHLTGILRGAVMQHAGKSVPAIFHGHGDAPHIAYIPLPFVGRRYADAHVLGLAAVLPRGLSRAERRIVITAFGEVVELKLGSIGEWQLEPVPQPSEVTTLDPETWSRPSRVWATVTPIIFDRFPRERDGRRAAEILADSCARIGLPAPIKVELSGFSKFIGAPAAREFRLRRRDSDRPRPATHAVFHFDPPVRGPVVLGAGRFFGLGLCRPWKQKRHEPPEPFA